MDQSLNVSATRDSAFEDFARLGASAQLAARAEIQVAAVNEVDMTGRQSASVDDEARLGSAGVRNTDAQIQKTLRLIEVIAIDAPKQPEDLACRKV